MATTYRVLVSTDLGGDPDDIQSLYRLIHSSDILRIEGIISSPGPADSKGTGPSAALIRHWVQRVDADHLRARGHVELMSEADILAVVKQGHRTARAPGKDGATAGSEWIIRRAHAPDPEGLNRPLWILAWGSLTDVAQALHDDPSIAGKIRIHYIGSSNTVNDPASRDFVYEHMSDLWPDLWWIENGVLPRFSRDTFRGVYLGGHQEGEWSNMRFIEANIRGRGSTHAGLFAQKCGDAFPVATWPAGSLKEGDSPTMLLLLSPVPAGAGDADDPTQPNWGGQYYRPRPDRLPNYYTDLAADAATCQTTINRWRIAFLSDTKTRWRWYN